MEVSNIDLVKKAAGALNSQKLGENFYLADVGCAVVSDSGKLYTGSCIGGSLGICAEQSAFSNMLSEEGPKIKKVVAVWKDEGGTTHAIPPCGRCREFMRMMSQDNLEAEVILGKDNAVKLKDLLPYPGWYSEKVLG